MYQVLCKVIKYRLFSCDVNNLRYAIHPHGGVVKYVAIQVNGPLQLTVANLTRK